MMTAEEEGFHTRKEERMWEFPEIKNLNHPQDMIRRALARGGGYAMLRQTWTDDKRVIRSRWGGERFCFLYLEKTLTTPSPPAETTSLPS